MKKKWIVPALFLTMTAVVFCQSDKGDFTLAPQIGVNFSTYAANDVSYDARTAFAAGIIAEYYFSDRWSFRSGLLYDPMGAKDAGDNIDKLNYMSIPLNANWHFGSGRNWYLNFGPTLAILLSATSEFSDPRMQDLDIKEAISDFDIGLSLGIGYKFDIAENTQMTIDYQGYGGFVSLEEQNFLPFDIRNSRSAFNLGVVLKL